jgi:hypothetical protein
VRAFWRRLRTRQSLQQIKDASYTAGYRQALTDQKTLAATEREDDASSARQPYPNE